MDGYGTELGEVLMSIQNVLAREENGEAGLLPKLWERIEVPDVPPSVVVRSLGFAGGRTMPPAPELWLLDPETGAGSMSALRRELELEVAMWGGGHVDEVEDSLFALSVDPAAEIRAAAGDAVAEGVLRAIVEVAQFSLRRSDRIYRVGADELALLLPETSADGAGIIRERLEASVARVLADRKLPDVRLGIRPMSLEEVVNAAAEVSDGRPMPVGSLAVAG